MTLILLFFIAFIINLTYGLKKIPLLTQRDFNILYINNTLYQDEIITSILMILILFMFLLFIYVVNITNNFS